MKTQDKPKTLSIRIPHELNRELRIHLAILDMSLQAYVKGLIEKDLKKAKKKREKDNY